MRVSESDLATAGTAAFPEFGKRGHDPIHLLHVSGVASS